MRKQFSRLFDIRPDYGHRVYGLDIFRAIAILIVVMGHGSFLINKVSPGFPYVRLPDGVELFFVLSGFLIGGMLIRLFNQENTPGFGILVHFWKRRWFRTLPNYYLVLLLNALFVYCGLIKGDINQFDWKFFLFLHNFSGPFVDFFWESWSLSVEEWFYILTPVAMTISAICFRNHCSPKQFILFTILFFIFGSLLYRMWMSAEQMDAFWLDVKFRKVVITRLDAIMFGVLFAWFRHYYPESWKRYAKGAFIAGLALLYATIVPARDPNDFFSKTYYFSFVSMAAALLLPLADQTRSFSGMAGKALTHISMISYSMYLINLGLVAMVIEHNFMPESATGALFWYVVYWVTVIGVSTLLYKYFEKPVMDLRDR
jgi:peptidoglycan/LPS O-acetylase OafA/YrhL